MEFILFDNAMPYSVYFLVRSWFGYLNVRDTIEEYISMCRVFYRSACIQVHSHCVFTLGALVSRDIVNVECCDRKSV